MEGYPFTLIHRLELQIKQARLRSAVGRAPDSQSRRLGLDTRPGHILSFLLALIQEGQLSVIGEKYVHEVLVNSLGGLSMPRKSVVK